MTTFTSGAVIALTLDQDDRLTFVGSGSCTVTPTYGSSWVIRLDAPGTVIGPFRQNVSLSITTTRDGSYTTDNYGDQPTYVTASTNSVTGGIDYFSAGLIRVKPGSADLATFDLFGDSISEYCSNKTTISSLTQSNGVATAAATAHGLVDGAIGHIVGASDDPYNGPKTVSVISANSFSYSVSAAASASATGAGVLKPFRRTDTNWFDYANVRLGGRLQLIRNYGQGGKMAADMVNRVTDLEDSTASNVIVELGRNDITNGQSVAQIVSNLTTIISAFLSYGKKVWVCTIPPVEVSHAGYSVSNANRENQVNAWIRRFVLGAGTANIVLVDAAKYLVDPTSTGGAARTAYLNATDHVHPTPLGARLGWGEALYQAAVSMFPAWNTLSSSVLDAHTLNRQTLTSLTQVNGVATATLASHKYLAGEYVHIYGATPSDYNGLKQLLPGPASGTFTFSINPAATSPATGTLFVTASDSLIDNPTMQGTGGNTTGTVGVVTLTNPVPDNVTVKTSNAAVTSTVTVVARTDGIGNDLIATTATTGAATGNIQIKNSSTLNNRVTMGETIYAECGLNVSGMSSVLAVSFSLQATIDGVVHICEPFSNGGLATAYFSQTDTGDLVVRTPDFTLPVGTSMTVLDWVLQTSFTNAAGGATIKIGRVTVRHKLPYMTW